MRTQKEQQHFTLRSGGILWISHFSASASSIFRNGHGLKRVWEAAAVCAGVFSTGISGNLEINLQSFLSHFYELHLLICMYQSIYLTQFSLTHRCPKNLKFCVYDKSVAI